MTRYGPGCIPHFASVVPNPVGLLGSRRKRETLLKTLEDEGFDDVQRARVVTPVGLDIGAQTPEEIAVSIVGQLIAIRRGK